jgi:hypothetical protein
MTTADAARLLSVTTADAARLLSVMASSDHARRRWWPGSVLARWRFPVARRAARPLGAHPRRQVSRLVDLVRSGG